MKKFIFGLILGIVICAVGLFGFYYLGGSQKGFNPLSLLSSTDSLVNTYEDPSGTFSFKYPVDWGVNSELGILYGVSVQNKKIINSNAIDLIRADIFILPNKIIETSFSKNLATMVKDNFGIVNGYQVDKYKTDNLTQAYIINLGQYEGDDFSMVIGAMSDSGSFKIIEKIISSIKIDKGKISIFAKQEIKSLEAAQIKGKDAQVKGYLSTARAVAKVYYDNQSSSYSGFCASSDFSRLDLKSLASVLTCKDSKKDYAVSASLPSGGFWCVGAFGVEKFTSKSITGTSCGN